MSLRHPVTLMDTAIYAYLRITHINSTFRNLGRKNIRKTQQDTATPLDTATYAYLRITHIIGPLCYLWRTYIYIYETIYICGNLCVAQHHPYHWPMPLSVENIYICIYETIYIYIYICIYICYSPCHWPILLSVENIYIYIDETIYIYRRPYTYIYI